MNLVRLKMQFSSCIERGIFSVTNMSKTTLNKTNKL
uniref:Uncharacterized protein n=1 Tax=Arundo donax TaxID=35708 RepID=A0A0A9CS00_ARUDO